jgi:nitrogen fixation NifU-like protein
MTADLRDLYQEVILDHNKRPRNFRKMEDADREADGHNPLCGDKVTVYVKMEDGIIRDVSFVGSGCAISTASASLMTELLKGKTEEEAEALFQDFRDMVAGPAPSTHVDLGKLKVLAGVREFPARVKCATLAWHTVKTALEHPGGSASTE